MQRFRILIMLLLFAGCSSVQVTDRIGESIQPGMPKQDLVALLGKPIRITDIEKKDDTWSESLIYKETVTRGTAPKIGESILRILTFGLLRGETNIYQFDFEDEALKKIKSQPERINLSLDTNVNMFQQTEPSQ